MQLIALICAVLFLNDKQTVQDIYYNRSLSQEATVEQLQAASFERATTTNLGTQNGTYWFKIDDISQARAIISIESAHACRSIVLDSEGKTIDAMPYTRYPSFFVSKSRTSFPIYLKTDFYLEAHFPITMRDELEFSKAEKMGLMGVSFFYGAIVSLFLASLIFFFILHSKRFLFYAIIILSIGVCLLAKDNFLYTFGVNGFVNSIVELIGHYSIGICATVFSLYYLKLGKCYNGARASLVGLSVFSTITFLCYILLETHWAFYLTDILTSVTVVVFWGMLLTIVKNTKKRAIMIGIYLLNAIVLINSFVLHNFGLSFIALSADGIKWIVLIDFTLIAFSLIHSFKSLQSKTSRMKIQIKVYLDRIANLNNTRKMREADDVYMESLINDFDLTNIEIKVLNGIATGYSSSKIMATHELTKERFDEITTSLYNKLGLEDQKDLSLLVGP